MVGTQLVGVGAQVPAGGRQLVGHVLGHVESDRYWAGAGINPDSRAAQRSWLSLLAPCGVFSWGAVP